MRKYITAVALGAAALAAAVLSGCGGAGGTGRTAGGVFRSMQAAGLPITEGRPASSKFSDVVDHNRCADSRGVVREDASVGWALICVGINPSYSRRMLDAMNGAPLLLGPLYADADGGRTVVFGIGWPISASRVVERALGGGGAYMKSA